jgi:para-aminobenzoate synthetase component 1
MLESLAASHRAGRYSIFAFDPVRTVSTQGDADPLDHLTGLCRPWCEFDISGTEVPLSAAWIGHINYEAGYVLEPSAGRPPQGSGDCISRWSLFDTFLIHDALGESWTITAAELPPEISASSRPTAARRLDRLEQLFRDVAHFDGKTTLPDSKSELSTPARGCWNYSRDEYLAKSQRVLRYIREGDVYQVNLARRFRQPFAARAIHLYERLCNLNPAAYAAYLDTPNGEIVSSSPELFLSLQDRVATTRPIKGTRPRLGDPSIDELARRDLITSGKDRAELDMIIDLERNDLGRVCEPGSVVVESRGDVEVLPTVFHRTATISGHMRSDTDAFDLIRACFPGGSITGAPKIRAMQIIRELERGPRGAYCGAIGYISLNGDMQLNLAIRTMTVANGWAEMHVGSGIVADSTPEMELAELDAKAAAMLEAISSFEPPISNTSDLDVERLKLETHHG